VASKETIFAEAFAAGEPFAFFRIQLFELLAILKFVNTGAVPA
jgi:hypothetical protein